MINNQKLDENQGCSGGGCGCGGCSGCSNKKTALREEQFDSLTIYFDHVLGLDELREKCRRLLVICSNTLSYLEGCFASHDGLIELVYVDQNIDFIPSTQLYPYLYIEGSNLDAEAISELFSY